uniref:Uncharacterized protein n=1 Tax=Panagrolaimus sp. JU765 TaxID=591449 RepID=A0AC34QG35_9BILA
MDHIVVSVKVVKYDADCNLLSNKKLQVEINEKFSVDSLVKKVKNDIGERNYDSTLAIVYRREPYACPSNAVALDKGHLIPIRGRYSHVFLDINKNYEVHLIEKREGTPELEQHVFDDCSPSSSSKILSIIKKPLNSEILISNLLIPESTTTTTFTTTASKKRKNSSKNINKNNEQIDGIIMEEKIINNHFLPTSILKSKVNLVQKFTEFNGVAAFEAYKTKKEDKDTKALVTKVLGLTLMENCDIIGTPSPDEKREIVKSFCKWAQREDVESILTNTRNTGSLDNWIRRTRSKRNKAKHELAENGTSEKKSRKSPTIEQEKQPTIPDVPDNPIESPNVPLFDEQNDDDDDWEDAAFRL